MSDTEQYAETHTSTSSSGARWKSYFAFGWIRTPIGLLKLGEFVILLLALIIMSTVDMVGSISSIEFFIFVQTAAWIFVMIVIIFYILNVYHRLPAIVTSNIVMAICCAAGVVSELICSSVVIGKFSYSGTISAAGAFGLIAMFLFLFETVYYVIKGRRDGFQGSGNNSAANTAATLPPTQEYQEDLPPEY